MDIIRLSTDWARAEVFSAKMVWLTSLIVVATSCGFAYFGKTAMARAYIWPNLVAGIFLIAIGIGLYLANNPRIAGFESEYKASPETFVRYEIARAQKSKKELTIVLKVLPSIILLAALLVILVANPIWRAIGITLVALSVILSIVDSNTDARNSEYLQQLENYEQNPSYKNN
jgi:ABC-2 type transport system permease protein